MVNTTGVDAMVSIIGGTVSNISVDGNFITNTVPATGIYLPAGSAITITYSVIPTIWQWYGQ